MYPRGVAMPRALKILLSLALLIAVMTGAFLGSLYLGYPRVGPAEDLKIVASDAQLERGRYLATTVCACLDCHGERDYGQFSGPVVPGTEGQGGARYGAEAGVAGELFAPNITPAALSGWSDGELARAIVSGVSRDGAALHPIMPYGAYAELCQEDLEAIVAFLRTLPAIDHEVPARTLEFPMNLIVRTLPEEKQRPLCPEPDDPIAVGEYLAKIGGCDACHTPRARGEPLSGYEWAGGVLFAMPGGAAISQNLTPDPITGLSRSRDAFLARFEARRQPIPVAPGEPNTVMPWTRHAAMTREDLTAIYEFLQTVRPVQHAVDAWTDAPPS